MTGNLGEKKGRGKEGRQREGNGVESLYNWVLERQGYGFAMNRCLLLMLAASAVVCVGCAVRTTTTITEEISLAGPTLDGKGKVLDPDLRLTVMHSAPCKVTLHDSADRQLFSLTVPAGKSIFTIAVERGNLLIKRFAGQTLFKTPVSAAANAVLTQESDLSKMHPGKSLRFPFRVGSRPSDPLFHIIVDRGGR